MRIKPLRIFVEWLAKKNGSASHSKRWEEDIYCCFLLFFWALTFLMLVHINI